MPINRQLTYNLAFTADTAKVRQQIQELQRSLDELMRVSSSTGNSMGITKELQEASQAAAMLKAQVEGAINIKTGTLDLGLLNKSFQDAGVKLSDYQSKLANLGPAGTKAFNQVAQSILSAEVPLRQSSGLLTEFATTLKNTARWQLSSSILHGFMGAIQSAYGYAQDLNESLNNIRIVTGQSTEQMAQFATQANQAAKALSTTTTEYTNASLIYYQQGLNDQEVQERTDITIKMANVARESAETVSDQMTAIWNNFDNGTRSLEYYADAMTALGAATATSTDEIAEGISKFAGVADTIGLSYEYAAASLATITATTRQSADIVGNALKTLFSRLQGLKLGETLDDGTTLNQYSEALDKVGVSIKDANGDLRSMDDILSDLGGRWDTLSKDQQAALAQTVAGVRQYTQLITLMDNWDFFEKNLDTIEKSEGTLQEQQEIYAEGWEAARDRVRAALEDIYGTLVDADFFTSLADGISGFLKLISSAIDGLGGFQGVLAGLGVVLTNVFSKDMAAGIDRFIYNLQDKTEIANQMRQEAIQAMQVAGQGELGEAYASLVEPQQALINNAERLSETEKAIAQNLIDQQKKRVENVEKLNQESKAAEALLETEIKRAQAEARRTGQSTQETRTGIAQVIQDAQTGQEEIQKLETAVDTAFESMSSAASYTTPAFRKLFEDIDVTKLPNSIQDVIKRLRDTTLTSGQATDALTELSNVLYSGVGTAFGEDIRVALSDAGLEGEELEAAIERVVSALNKAQGSAEAFKKALADAKTTGENAANNINNFNGKTVKAGEAIAGAAKTLTSYTMAIKQMQGMADVFTDDSISSGEKLLSLLTSLGFVIPSAISGFKGLKTALEGTAIATGSVTAAAGVITGVIAAIGIAFVAYNKYWEEVRKTHLEAAEASQEALQALQDEKSEVEDLNNIYKTALASYEETGENKEELIQAAFDVADSLGIENAAILVQRDDYDALTASIERAIKAKNDELLLQNKRAQRDQADVFEDEMREGVGYKDSTDNSYRANLGGFINSNEFLKELQEQNYQSFDKFDENNRYIDIHTNLDTQSLMTAYEEVQDVIDRAYNYAEEHNIDVSRVLGNIGDLQDWLKKSSEAYDKLAQLREEGKGLQAENALRDLVNESDITTLSEYNALLKEAQSKLLELKDEDGNQLFNKDEALEAAQAYLELNDATSQLANSRKLLNQQKADSPLSQDELDKLYEDYAEKGQGELFLSLAPDMLKSPELIDAGIAELQAQADEEELKVKLTTYQDAQDNWKEDMDTDAIQKFQAESGIDWGNEEEGIIEFSEFLSMTYQQQIAYLKGLESETQNAIDSASDDGLQAAKDKRDALRDQIEELQNFVNAYDQASFQDRKAMGISEEEIEASRRELIALEEEYGNLKDTIENWDELTEEEKIKIILDTKEAENQLKDLREKIQNAASDKGEVQISLTFDENEFEILQGLLGDSTDQFITTLDTGTHILTGDVEQLQQVLASAEAAPFLEQIKNLQQTGDAEKEGVDGLFAYQQLEPIIAAYNELAAARQAAVQEGETEYLAQTQAEYDQLRETIQQYAPALSEVDANMTVAAAGALNAASSFKEFEDILLDIIAIDMSDGVINTDYVTAGAENLLKLAENYDNCAEEAADFRRELIEGTDESKQAAMENLMLGMYTGDLAKEFDLSADEIESYAKQLKESGKYTKANDKALVEMAKDQLRFNRAVESAEDNMEDWQAALQKANKTGLVNSDTINELKDAYGDLLDIDGDLLSDSFAASADNLALMQRALEGDQEAYRQLQEMAQHEIEAKVGITMDDADFWTAHDAVEAAMIAMDFENIEVGASLDDAAFLQALTDMVNAAGMTADQATSYLSSMGVDAEVVEDTTTATEQSEVPAYTTVGRTASAVYRIPTITSSTSENGVTVKQGPVVSGSAIYPYFDSVPANTTNTTQKQNKAFSLKVTSANKSSGGAIKHSSSNSGGGGGGGGGSCFVASTPVTTLRGYKRIENIKIGDIVLSYNETFKKNEYSEVLQTMIHDTTEEIYSLYIENEILRATGIHKFLITRNDKEQWLMASELSVGDLVHFANLTYHKITKIDIAIESRTVYNFEVSGNHNYYVGKNRILAHNKGGGGGGGSAKPHTASVTGPKLEQPTRYQRVDQALTDSNRSMDRLGKASDRAFGTKRLEQFDQNIKLLTKDTDILNEKLIEVGDTTSGYLAEDLQTVRDTFKDLPLEIQVDETGFITNFEELSKAAVNAYNEVMQGQYDWDQSQEGVDENSETYKNEKQWWDDQVEIAKDIYDKRMEAISQWQETWNLGEEVRDLIADNYRAIADERLNKISMELELVVKVRDIKRDVRDFMQEIAEAYGDVLTHTFDKANFRGIASLLADNAQAEIEMLSHYEDQYNKLVGELEKAKTGNLFDAEGEAISVENVTAQIEELTSQVISSGEALLEWIDYWENMVPEAIDAARERFDYFLNELDHSSTVLDSIKELYALQGITYKTQAGFDRLQKTTQERLNAARSQAILNREWYERTSNLLTQAEERLAGIQEGTLAYDQAKATRDALLEEFNEAQEAMLSSAQDAMEQAYEMYNAAIEKTIYDFNKTISDGAGLDNLSDKYDHYIDLEEQYFDKVNEAYHVAAWYDKIDQDIQNTQSKYARDKLRALQEEINSRRESNTLNQYDLDVLEAKYKVLQAQIELEDVQNNKSQLRLVRDRQGNWNYQYTANQDDILAAQQKMLDAENEWYNLAKDQTKEVTRAIIDNWTDCEEAINDLYSDTSNFIYNEETKRLELTEEAQKRLTDIREYYVNKNIQLERELQVAINDMNEAGAQDMIHLAASSVGDIVTEYDDGAKKLVDIMRASGISNEEILSADLNDMLSMVSDFKSMSDLEFRAFTNNFATNLNEITKNTTIFEKTLDSLLGQCETAFEDLNTTIEDVADNSGTKIDILGDQVDETSGKIESLTENGESAVTALQNQMDAAYQAAVAYDAFASSVENAVMAMQKLAIQGANAVRDASGVDVGPDLDRELVETDDISHYISNQINDYLTNGTEFSQADLNWLINQRIDKLSGLSTETRENYSDPITLHRVFNAAYAGDKEAIELMNLPGYYDKDWEKKAKEKGFASGGYTGSWGDEGRLAFLHEKELVLNAEDTKNILSAVDSVRTITPNLFRVIGQMLDNSGINTMNMLNGMFAGVSSIAPTTSETLEQSVHIEATFPNVTSSNEIEQALLNLTNDAAQYSRRRKS